MSFKDCLQTAVDTGRLAQSKADEAKAEFDEALEGGKAEGLSDDAAADLAADKALKQITTLKQAKRWERINELRKAHVLNERIRGSKKPWQELDNVMEEVQLSYEARRGQMMAHADDIILKYMPKKGGLVIPIDNMDNVARAAYGDATNPEAEAFAKTAQDVMELGRQRLNMEGASIPENPLHRFPQTQDRALVQNAPAEEWINDHLDNLDWELMRYQGKEVPVDQRHDVLEKTYNAIITNGDIRLSASAPNNLNLAGRLSRERFLYYKDGEAWIAMQKKYGTGSFYHQLIEQIDSMARDGAIMEYFGPNPNTMKAFAERTMRNKMAEMTVASPQKTKGMENNKTKALNRFDAAWQLFNRSVDTGSEDFMAQTGAAVRTVTGTALLGNVLFASFTDAAVGMWARSFYGMPQTKLILDYFKGMATGKATARRMIRDGVVFESGIARAYENQRYIMAMEGPRLPRAMSDINYRAQGAHLWTTVGKSIAAGDLSAALADFSSMKFDDVPFVHVMRSLGITEADWELVKNTPKYEPKPGAEFLRPLDMFNNAEGDAAKRAADKFMRLQAMFVRDAVPSPLLRARTFLGEQIPATSLAGQIIKSTAQLALFPATIHFNHWKKIFSAPTLRDKLWLGSKFFIYTTLAGAMVTQLKDAISGKEFHPMDTKEFWIRAMLNGGAGAIIGDLVYDNINISNSPYKSETPLMGQWRRFQKLTFDNMIDAANGEDDLKVSKDAADFALGLLPKPWPVKLLIERGITDRLLEETDPAAYARKIQAQQEWEAEQGQGTWWGVGEEPDLGKLFGYGS